MGLHRKNGELWYFEEGLYPDVTYGFRVSRELVAEKDTGFQKLTALDTPRFGRVLVLDDIVQLSEEDEKIYHEMLVHWPLFAHPGPHRVLVIGGGDGGSAREALKHQSVEEVVLVDIDREVVEASRTFLPQLSAGAFDDPRLRVLNIDAAQYIKDHRDCFDVVVMDTTDPIGPAETLFGTDFVKNVFAALKDGGIAIRQAGSLILQPSEFRGSFKQMEVIFDEVQVILLAPATYLGGYFTMVAGIKGSRRFADLAAGAAARYRESGLETDWYSDEMHTAATTLPPVVKRMLAEEKYGEEIIMDLQPMDLPSTDRLALWSTETCKEINMLAYGQPLTSGSGTEDGDTFVQYIETSAINYRHFGRVGCANVFTCAELPVSKALAYSLKFFNAGRAVCWHLPRGSFGTLDRIRNETRVFEAQLDAAGTLVETTCYAPRMVAAHEVLQPDFELPTAGGVPGFELILDLYDGDYSAIVSSRSVVQWAGESCRVAGLEPVGEADAPQFGHAKKKTSGPSVIQFFRGGSSISHYSANWLAVASNIVSSVELRLRDLIGFTLTHFQARRAIGFIVPRGATRGAEHAAAHTLVFEIHADDPLLQ